MFIIISSSYSLEETERILSTQEIPENLDEEWKYEATSKGKSKRLTVDFMGMQVSYPQYLRLVKLQEKVVKLNKVKLWNNISCEA